MNLLNAILRSDWMIEQSSIDPLATLAKQYMAQIVDHHVDAATIGVGMFSELPLPSVPQSVALVPIVGVMAKADTCGAKGTRSVAQMIEAAANDPNKQSIILFFDNVPGGQVDGTQELAQAIQRAKSLKPVVAAVSGMACSAGIWAATQANEIYTLAGTDQVGCIGVMARFRKKADGAESEYEVVISDESPKKNAEFADLSLYKSQYLNPVARIFKQEVKNGRGDRLKDESVLDGLTYVAADAKKAGLIDGTMPFAKVVQRAQYLTKNYRKNMTGTNNNASAGDTPTFAFQHVLRAASAEAATPVEEGFALTEAQMNTLDAHIASVEASVETATQRAEAAEANAQTLTEQLATAQADLAAANARIAELAAGAANPEPDPTDDGDPSMGKKGPVLTSFDLDKQRRLGALKS